MLTPEPTADDLRLGAERLVPLTHCACHGVWEVSRDRTRDRDGSFVKRHALTRSSIGRISIVV